MQRNNWFSPIIIIALFAFSQATAQDALDCPETSDPTNETGSVLGSYADPTTGVVYDNTSQTLALKRNAGEFAAADFASSEVLVYADSADFDEDGWPDFVGTGLNSNFHIKFFKNKTYNSPAPDWNDPEAVRVPNFEFESTVVNPSGNIINAAVTAGDFNGDGHQDFLVVGSTSGNSSNARCGYYKLFKGNGDGTFQSGYNFVSNNTQLGYCSWTHQMAVVDYNGDGFLDIIRGTKTSTSSGSGTIDVLINQCPSSAPPCAVNPTFTRQALISNINFGSRSPHNVALGEVTNDGIPDLVVTGPSTNKLYVYEGLSGGGFDTDHQSVSFQGGGTFIGLADFNLDGQTDMMVATDNFNYNSGNGGELFYWENDGDSAPFSGSYTQQLTFHNNTDYKDYDVGFLFNYDNDPDNTMDILIADGNDGGVYHTFANRVESTYVDCGDVVSGVLDRDALGLDNTEMVVTSARITPNVSLPYGTSVTFYMSNVTPPVWVQANPCADNPSDYCASFPSAAGLDVRWKATLCSDPVYHTNAPSISGVEIKFDYEEASVHYRSGVVVHDGVAYLGGFVQPGDRGRMFAVNAGLTQTYWDAGEKLDLQSTAQRNVYTSKTNGQGQLAFEPSNASDADLQTSLTTNGNTQTQELIQWWLDRRFGVNPSKLGSVERSTPAVLTPPGAPWYYNFLDGAGKAEVDAFIAARASRKTLLLYGSKDGAVHAHYTNPQAIGASENGSEAWAYIPSTVGKSLLSDKTNNTVSHYPDGSPTLADIKINGNYETVALLTEGNGGNDVFAIKVTETVQSDGTVTGPTGLWRKTPGGSKSGRAYSKPAVARVSNGGNEEFHALVATGLAPNEGISQASFDKGKRVFGYNAATGAKLWRFDAKCAVTTNILLYESGDENEPGSPSIDGFLDRAVFADACGYVYKLDISQIIPTSNANNPTVVSIGPHSIGSTFGVQHFALFSTQHTTGALGEKRPIVGSIAGAPDGTGKITLFFGTGGHESYDPTKPNQFYAVYSEDGSIRSTYQGQCTTSAGTTRCEKFYGGATVTNDQVILSRSLDPLSGTGVCDYGESELVGFRINDDGSGGFAQDFANSLGSAIASSLYASAGAVYASSLDGKIIRVGTPRANNAGDDTTQGTGGGTYDGGGSGTGGQFSREKFTVYGYWKKTH